MLEFNPLALRSAELFAGALTPVDVLMVTVAGAFALVILLVAYCVIVATVSRDKARRTCATKILNALLRFTLDLIRAIVRLIRGGR
ncbi:hypothetical protein ACIBHY_29880 [Nonomuraea sp. NPDC050547]|uniref:hypothetical protein n=1 Tax=Nonomuraea sp. NPDC050547 TaxID=3364368 RepID=UPI0037B07E9B